MQLEINDRPVDLPTNARGLVRLQNSLAALSDLDKRTGSYSWSLTLPFTRRNDGVLGVALRHPQALDKFSNAFAFRLTAGGQRWEGSFRLSAIRGGYTGNLNLASFGWARALEGKTLPELRTLRSLAYDGTQLEALMSQGPDETDLQFPLLAWGNFFAPPSVTILPDDTSEETPTPAALVIDYPLAVDDYPPSVYLVNVLQAIFREAGYFLQGPILQDAQVRQWCISPAGSGGQFWPWGSLLPARSELPYTVRLFNVFSDSNNSSNVSARDTEATTLFWLLHTTRRVSGGTRAMLTTGGEYAAPTAGVYGFRWSATTLGGGQTVSVSLNGNILPGFDGYNAGFAPVLVALVAFRGGEGYEGADGGICTTGTGVSAPGQQRVLSYARLNSVGNWGLLPGEFSGEAQGVYLEAGDVVRLLLLTRRSAPQVSGGLAYDRRTFELTFSAAALECISFDGPTLLNPAAVLPPLAQAEVVKDFLLRTNTVPVADEASRVVTLLSREAHVQAQGPALELDAYVDPATLEFLPALDGVSRVVFRPAEAGDDSVAEAGDDVVGITLPGDRGEAEKTISGPFAAWGMKTYSLYQYLPGQLYTVPLRLLCVASQDALRRDRSEVGAPELSGLTPRLVRYLGPDPDGARIPFGTGSVPWARADYGGPLAWDGDEGAVATHYRSFLAAAARGHVARISASLTPARYVALSPGRRVWLLGAEYSIEKAEGFDPENPTTPTTLTLLRRI